MVANDTPSSKKLLRALRGESVWPPPIWLMRQAGRYLPEYRAVRAGAGDFIRLCTTPEMAAEVTLQPIRRYGFDAAILFSDILMLPWALGQGLRFAEGEGPRLPPLQGREGVDALRPEQVPEAIQPILETIRRVRAQLDDRTALIGFAGAPFTVACYMVEGGGSSDFAQVRRMAYQDRPLFDRLISLLTESTIEYLSAQAEAGAEVLMLFDSWAGLLSPNLFRAFVTGPAKVIARALKDRFPHVPVIGFPRMAGVMLGDYAHLAAMDGIGMDTAMDPARAIWLVPSRTALQGNLDPQAVVTGGTAMRNEAQAILLAMKGRPFIFNLGHGIVPQTSPEHVADLVDWVRRA